VKSEGSEVGQEEERSSRGQVKVLRVPFQEL
jgi:hypothetical protein